MAKFDPKAFAKKMKPYYAKVTVADPITGVEMDFENQIKADKWLAQREITKVSSPSKVSFTNPVTGKTETVLDSSAMETKLTNIKSNQVKDLRSRNVTIVKNMKDLRKWIASNKPEHVKSREQYKADLAGFEQELASNYEKLDIPYNPNEPVDASPDTGGFWSGVFSSIGDAFTPSDEERFKAKTRKEKMGQVASGSVELPEGVSGYQWAQSEADRLWDEKVNFDPTPKSDAELRDISGRKE